MSNLNTVLCACPNQTQNSTNHAQTHRHTDTQKQRKRRRGTEIQCVCVCVCVTKENKGREGGTSQTPAPNARTWSSWSFALVLPFILLASLPLLLSFAHPTPPRTCTHTLTRKHPPSQARKPPPTALFPNTLFTSPRTPTQPHHLSVFFNQASFSQQLLHCPSSFSLSPPHAHTHTHTHHRQKRTAKRNTKKHLTECNQPYVTIQRHDPHQHSTFIPPPRTLALACTTHPHSLARTYTHALAH